MAMMCEECKCSIYLEDKPDGTRSYGGCENECPCCNDPDYKSSDDILSEIITYIKLHLISLDQDSEKIWNAMDQIDDLESDEYEELNIQDIRNGGEIAATNHILKYIEEVTNV